MEAMLRHLECGAEQKRIGVLVHPAQFVFDPRIAIFGCDLREINRSFECLNLAEEKAPVAVGVTTSQANQLKSLIYMVPTEGVEPTHPHGY